MAAGDLARLLAEAEARHAAGDLPAAARGYEAVLKRAPDQPAALALLGALRLQQGEAAAAAKLLRRAVARSPADPTPCYNLGLALSRLGRQAEAAEALAALVAAHPDHADGWKVLGDARRAGGDLAGAGAAWRAALAARPDHAGALYNLGVLAELEGDAATAEALARRLLTARPGDARGHANLGVALKAQRRPAEAEAALRQALALDPANLRAGESLGELLLQAGRPAEAEAIYAALLPDRPAPAAADPVEALSGLLRARAALARWDGQPALMARLLAREAEGPNPFLMLGFDLPPARRRRVAEAHARRAAAGVQPLPARRPAGGGQIRIGYLSSDFRAHATAHLLAEVLELHDRAAFAVHAYATWQGQPDAMTARIAAAVEGFHAVGGLPDAALAARIAADGIDILVDLHGWTEGNRLRVLVFRPAPVQVTWLGYPGTTGAPWVDYAIVDGVVAPAAAEAEFTETLVRLPGCYQPNDRQRPVGPAPDRAEAGLPAQGLVLCCFAQRWKIGPEPFGAWMEAMAALPGAVLWLLAAAPEAAQALRAAAGARGIDPARLVFAPRAPLEQHLARYRLADLALDTWPYGSHTTASDALWAGCPLLALRAGGFAGRVSDSVLRAAATPAGIPGVVVADAAAFVAEAVRLGRDPAALAALRVRAAACRDSALFDTPRFVRGLEAAYRTMMDRAVAGLPAAPITLAG